ncbi:MAG TPA: prepilin-type N-terminal cleavage/methylation domain-containing protein [bacterium]|nr:prepilin-type N-terminal cleavage/methylation domain-containing protein [bacterium]
MFRRVLSDDRGFTLLEVMLAIVLMMIGLLAAAGSFPSLTRAALYAKDQTRATNLAQQQLEIYRNTVTTTLGGLVGNYGTVASQYFDQNGGSTTQAAAYFTRDVQIQYWTWSVTSTSFVVPASPYVTPSGSYVYHISIATHWPVRGQTAFVTGTTSGCVTGGTTVQVGLGCVTLSSFSSP